MSGEELKAWPEGWGILFAVQASGGRIPGKVRAMKYVSVLQRDGFPIENRFINAEMGPYDEAVHQSALELAKYGLLRVEEVDTGKEKKRIDYYATDTGKKFFAENVVPLLNGLPFQLPLRLHFRKTRTEFRFKKTDDLVKKLHEDLYLDDVGKFRTALADATKQASAQFKEAQARFQDYCPVCLNLLGSLEFTETALQRISQDELFDPYSGKNHVLFNGEKLLAAAGNLRQHEHIDDPRIPEDSPLGAVIAEIRYRLHCVEWNSRVYSIVPLKEEAGIEPESPEIF